MRIANIVNLGIKELRGLVRDPMLLVLIAYAFTLSVYSASTAMASFSPTGAGNRSTSSSGQPDTM